MPIQPSANYQGGRNWNLAHRLFDTRVQSWLNEKIRELILDYLIIQDAYKQYGVPCVYDYSYLITPAFKALEGTLIQVAHRLGLPIEKSGCKIGVVFSEENLERFYDDVLNKIEGLAEEHKLDVQQWLNNARRLLRHLRHSPAHFMGDRKENWDKAFFTGDQILFTINEMCLSLITSGVLSIPERKPLPPPLT